MPTSPLLCRLRWAFPLLAALAVASCATSPQPRTDDPLEKFNRKMYTVNDKVDKAVIRPVAVGYRKITNQPVRTGVSNFFDNIRLPISVINDLLQARPKQALQNTSRFVVNLTIGFVGIMDPATALGIPEHETDFGITMARWGIPEGDYLVLPLIGPTTARDVWRLPVDSYFDPLSWVRRNHKFHDGEYYVPELIYLISLRSSYIDAEDFLKSAYDPYIFMRDAYRQRRISEFYDGNPPASVIEQQQGLDQKNFDPDELLQQQHDWEKTQPKGSPGNG